ncbi:MAG TPA: thioether cross-link-forming SCIFF peptide maturase [Clostridiaceae bacterium]|nr:thioether cross-link-forming SCIFF peptide maturase [Clostridiaceae bacterium]
MIHKFSMFGTNIVADVNSGAVHVLDNLAYELLDYLGKASKEEIIGKFTGKYEEKEVLEALEELNTLVEEGLLFSEDIYEDYVANLKREPVVKALCLHISHDCNLRCKYCFASTGNFGGARTMMPEEVGIKAIDFLIEKSGNRRNLEVDFFGGEPMLNFDTVRKIVLYAREREKSAGKVFRFTITTNGTLMKKEDMEFINKHFYNIVLSIDGRREINDRMRVFCDGSGCYDRILPRIKDIVKSRNGQNYYVRGTFTRNNLDFSEDVFHLADEGFDQISIEPVVAAKDTGYDIREEDLEKVLSEYEKLAFEYVNRRKSGQFFNFFHFMIDLSQGPCVIKRISGCGSGHEYLAITPEGDIYPCHQFVGKPEFKMGNIMDGSINEIISDTFKKSNVYSRPECQKCWAKFYCSGGCAANSYQFNEDINVPYRIGCEMEKKRLECAIWIKTQI